MSKLIFCDLDGTLIRGNKIINSKDIEILRKWQLSGNKIVLCTGRDIVEFQSFLSKFDIPYDYLILSDGGYILDKEKVLYEEKILQDVGVGILDFLNQFEDIWSFYCDGNKNYGYLNGKTYDCCGQDKIEIDDDFVNMYHSTSDFKKIWFKQDNKQLDIALYCLDCIKRYYSNDIELHINQYYIDIVPKRCLKGDGIKRLLSLLNEDIIETLAIGDSYNDITMFETTDKSATFHHVDQEIKEYVDDCVDYVYEFLLKNMEG